MAQESSSSSPRSSSVLQVIVYWAIVGIPLSWGIYKTVQKSVPLFSAAPAAPAATPVPGGN